MPELPEVETTRLALLPYVAGQQITGGLVRRPEVIRQGFTDLRTSLPGMGLHIAALARHGKQLLIELAPRSRGAPADSHWLNIHLGMTGSLRVVGKQLASKSLPYHSHVIWRLSNGCELVFADPRRFGGIWYFQSAQELHTQRIAKLGPDALAAQPRQLLRQLHNRQRPIKAALLDQTVIAGLGNIYVDESLHAAGISPIRLASNLDLTVWQRMVRHIRRILNRAIQAGGSSLRDYVAGQGQAGGFQLQHAVYGRGGQPCRRCGKVLHQEQVAGRTTVWCMGCQR